MMMRLGGNGKNVFNAFNRYLFEQIFKHVVIDLKAGTTSAYKIKLSRFTRCPISFNLLNSAALQIDCDSLKAYTFGLMSKA